ncbi:MAG: PKD domain-containing protein, partial [Acidimicrobiia bacterium]|nr:PKD domain-containing protein [Acidimicrobiia bacterium]
MCTAALLVSSCGREDEGGTLKRAAAFTHSCVDLVCEFDGSSSTEVPGEAGLWYWSFGDGTFSTSRNPSHAYSEGGEFEVTLTVTEPGGVSAVHLEQLTIEEPVRADPGQPVEELSYGATEAGQYVTNWTHHTPGLSLTIGDGWGVADTLTAVEVGPLDKWGNRTCNPLARIVVLQGIYDPVQESMVPFNDLTDTLQEDGRINVISVTPTEVGGFSATRIDGTLNRDGLDLSWRFCRAGVRTFAFGTSDLDDPAYKWVWLPALSNLSFWVVHVESSDVLISLTHQDSDERLLEELEAIIASLEFHLPREPVSTRTLHSEFGDIEIFNGTARLHSLVEWSVGRFSGSRLGSPGVSGVTFSADVECRERGYAGGFTE